MTDSIKGLVKNNVEIYYQRQLMVSINCIAEPSGYTSEIFGNERLKF